MIRNLAFVAPLTLIAASAAALQSGGPSDTTPSGPFTGTLPNKEMSDSAAAVRHSATDVTAQRKIETGESEKIHGIAEQRRIDALDLAAKVKKGAVVPPDFAPRLRDAIDGDLQLWREEYKVPGKDYRAAQKRWLADDKAMTANDWALRRADWFTERDAWIAARKGVAAN